MNQTRKLYMFVAEGLWQKVKYHSEKAAGVWNNFWTMLVAGGWTFYENDLVNLQECLYKQGLGFHDPHECHYNQAVRVNNISFCKTYEKLHGRVPFLWENIEYGGSNLPYGIHTTQPKTKGRLVIGAEFIWQDEKVRVTSFNDEKKSLIACKYTVVKEGEVCDKCGTCQNGDETKISKRFAITAEDMAEKLNAIRKIKSFSPSPF